VISVICPAAAVYSLCALPRTYALDDVYLAMNQARLSSSTR